MRPAEDAPNPWRAWPMTGAMMRSSPEERQIRQRSVLRRCRSAPGGKRSRGSGPVRFWAAPLPRFRGSACPAAGVYTSPVLVGAAPAGALNDVGVLRHAGVRHVEALVALLGAQVIEAGRPQLRRSCGRSA